MPIVRRRCFVYMVQCRDGSHYTGWTTDPTSRTEAHNDGTGAKYCRSRTPVTLVYVLECRSMNEALVLEAAVKRLSPTSKRRLASIFTMDGGHEQWT